MNLFLLNPFVPGGWGENTVVENWAAIRSGKERVHQISKLHICINVWFGDEILGMYPCHVVTLGLANRVERNTLSGVEFEDVEVSDEREDITGIHFDAMPPLCRLLALGKANVVEDGDSSFIIEWSGEDFCLTPDARLVISENALQAIEKHNIENCGVIPLDISRLPVSRA